MLNNELIPNEFNILNIDDELFSIFSKYLGIIMTIDSGYCASNRSVLEIEQARKEDAATIEKIYKQASQEGNITAEDKAAILNMIKNHHRYYVVVAKTEQQVVGFATNEYAWGKLHLLDIAVEEKMRRQGIARRMIMYLIEYARKKRISEIYLEVLAKNKVALRFYKKLDFKERLFTGIISEGLYGLYYPITTQECGD